MPVLLVIDDEQNIRYSFRCVFADENIEVLTAGTAEEGIRLWEERRPDVVVLDIQLPDRTGLDVFQEMKRRDFKTPVLFITAQGTTDTALEAMKQGAYDYLIKPVDLDRLNQLLSRAFEAARLMRAPILFPEEESADRIVGKSAVMQEMCKTIGRIAPQDVNVLILGESGTGKELVARALYHHSRRADQPFLAINCAAIPETLLESELFGHEQGAFTGAARRRIGKFEQCDRGTLFLDEIGDMAPALQAKMLRVLQEQRFERLGSNEPVQTHVRVLAATNQNLDELVEQGRFRKDFYYRLKVATLHVPALRNRLEDVPELAHYFLFRFNRELGADYRSVAPETLELLQQNAWPGNVREMQSVIKEAMLQGAGHILFPEFLPADFLGKSIDAHCAPPCDKSGSLEQLVESLLQTGKRDLYSQAVEALERVLLPRVLRDTKGHQTQASELLGLSRGTLRQKLKNLGFSIDKVFHDESNGGDNGISRNV
ncbi:MAG: sigma-54 dependent transcriptional regulator [Gemmataceae bacterium]|nr:sigma-54 dependent transcriptional regulator [Gemmataceae bacterium]MCI0739205.1 sigma-54 dependent transcriptional regulator [Gemmataceae bacterium]